MVGKKLNIESEFGRLKTVLIHKPGDEIGRLTPNNKDIYLFDDLLDVEQAQEEHNNFHNILKEEKVNILYLEDLLMKVLKNFDCRVKLIDEIRNLHGVQGLTHDKFWNKLWETHGDPEPIIKILFNGLNRKELKELEYLKIKETDYKNYAWEIIPPIPNAYFTRDPGTIFRNKFISCQMNFDIRKRESILMRYAICASDVFEEVHCIYGNSEEEFYPLTIEGGDIIVLNEKAIAIGKSQRTKGESINRLARNLFEADIADIVYEVPIPPNRREFMHLDTVFTIIGKGNVVAYPSVIRPDGIDIQVFQHIPRYALGAQSAYRERQGIPFGDMLFEELPGEKMTQIPTGGDDIIASEREQWFDGTNTLALSEDKVIIYERNRKTIEGLEKVGIDVITFRGAELVKGRGGPRCMTMPLLRM